MGVPALKGATWKLDAVGQGQGVKDQYYVYATFTTASSDIVTMAGHGFKDGDGPVRVTTGTTLPTGLTAGVDYWIEKIDANTFYLHSVHGLEGGLASGTRVDITGAGTGTHTMHVSSFFIDNNMAGNGRRFYVKNIAIIGNGTNVGTIIVLEGTSSAPVLAQGELTTSATGQTNIVIPIYRYVKGIYLGTSDATGATVLVYTGR